MRLTFICSSLEPGRDGVGDYCRVLANHLRKSGIHIFLIALNDSFIKEAIEAEGELRLPKSDDLEGNVSTAVAAMRQFKTDWASFQFVPYGYDAKGILRSKISALEKLKEGSPNWHVMLHELWIGIAQSETMVNKAIGALQRRYVLRLMRRFSATVIHTSNSAYAAIVEQHGLQAHVLPLFSNIPISELSSDVQSETVAQLAQDRGLPDYDSTTDIRALVFGSIHPQWDPGELVHSLKAQARPKGKRIVMILLGRSGMQGQALKESLSSEIDDSFAIIQAGEHDADTISALMTNCHFGLSTMPWQLLGKSGSFIAMREHGLPVIITRQDWKPRCRLASQKIKLEASAHLFKGPGSLDLFEVKDSKGSHQPSIDKTADAFLSALNRP